MRVPPLQRPSIQRFSIFVRVGYLIKCSMDAHDSNYIIVTTPIGTMQATNNGPGKGPILWTTTEAHTVYLLRPDALVPNLRIKETTETANSLP
ncbi:hypothetical protein K438DRAFT_1815201 [Mycena galopus ATCC 62051]|nr:hypothetical protein K438DRAFT_1815201 [Mycena galopus ATCC 62051]